MMVHMLHVDRFTVLRLLTQFVRRNKFRYDRPHSDERRTVNNVYERRCKQYICQFLVLIAIT